jgi:glycosyltransferase involved in cell wall biosynthesis
LRIGIDASNLRSGGSITHLANLLAAGDPRAHGIERVVVWSWRGLAERLAPRDWLELRCDPALEAPLWRRLVWQRRALPRLAAESCDLLFAPGGSAPHGFEPTVSMSQNMLPFEYRELARYGVSRMALRLALLRISQARSFRRCRGLIFLSDYARRGVTAKIGPHPRTAVVPHGIEERFRCEPRRVRALAACSASDPLRLLYVSIVDAYKHQWQVAEAVARLRAEGIPLAIDFVGPAYPPALRRLRAAQERLDPRGDFLRYVGPVSHEELPERYRRAEIFVFASSCENLPNIQIEAMASGLPIAAAARGPMPEILAGAGALFDPEHPESIADALRALASDPERRESCARAAYQLARDYSWERCARETWSFLASVAAGAAAGGAPTARSNSARNSSAGA